MGPLTVLAEDLKKCSYCEATFKTAHELEERMSKHKYYCCGICYAGFVSEVILIEYKIHNHQEPSHKEPEQPPVPKEEPDVTIMRVEDPELQEAMRLIQVPDQDPFDDKLDARVGTLHIDNDHKVQCEECVGFSKKAHVQCYHPGVAYQSPFHQSKLFYTSQALVEHCKKKHM